MYAAYRLRLEAAFLADQGTAAAAASDWLAAQELLSQPQGSPGSASGSAARRSSGASSPFADALQQAGSVTAAASAQGALADAQASADRTAEDVGCGARLSVSPHFAEWADAVSTGGAVDRGAPPSAAIGPAGDPSLSKVPLSPKP